jgi:hypothetical protein
MSSCRLTVGRLELALRVMTASPYTMCLAASLCQISSARRIAPRVADRSPAHNDSFS